MLKSVWLSKLIVSSINESGSVLASYFRHLCGIVNSKECEMILFEPDGNEKKCFRIVQESCCIIPAPAIQIDNSILENVLKSKETHFNGNLLYCPLYMDKISAFGLIIFKTDFNNREESDITSALIAFSSVLYSESMGSIVNSFHQTVMSVKNLCVDYRTGSIVNRAVNNVSLEICENEFTVIVGASGSGKSSLLNVLGGMLTATEGTVIWKDTDVTKMNDKERTSYRANTVGFVFQRFNLISDLTVEENIKIAASLVQNPLSVTEVLEMVGLSSKAKSYPSQLSGGEQQRVCIARALVKRSGLLLCDEPTGSLDTVNALQIIKILQNISKKHGIPVVMITHNPNLVVLADHCITISNGMVSEDRLQPFALSAYDLKSC